MDNVTRALGQFVSDLEYEKLPDAVIREAKYRIGDFIGIALSATKTAHADKVRKLIFDRCRPGNASVWGTGKTLDPVDAALANATISFHLELDDVHRTSHTHPGVCTIPTALAICQAKGLSGKDLICSIIAGYDAVIRVGLSVSPSIYIHRVFSPFAALGAIGSAASAAYLYNFDADQAMGTLSNASFLGSAAPHENYKQGSTVKEFIVGWCNFNGMSAAELVSYGFSGADTAFQGNLGFCKALSREYDLNRITDGLGEEYRILETGTKPYACCRQHHAAIDCVLEMRKAFGIVPEDVDHINVSTFTVAARGDAKRFPSVAAAKYSLPYAIAISLTAGNAWRNEYREELLTDKKILELVDKVRISISEDMDRLYDEKWPSEVEIVMKDGSVHKMRRDLMKGEPEYPLTEAELKSKFKSLAMDAITDEASEELWDIIMHLEEDGKIQRLIKMIS